MEIRYLQYCNDLLRFCEDGMWCYLLLGALAQVVHLQARPLGSVAVPSARVQQGRATARRSVLRRELHTLLFLSLITKPYPNNVLL